MDDIFYPDNSKREGRVHQLADDISNLVHSLAGDAATIKSTLLELDVKIRDMYKGIQVDIPPSDTKEYNYHSWIINVIKGMQPSVDLVPGDLAVAGVSFQFVNGHITDKNVLEQVVGVPLWIGVGGGALVILDALGVFGEKRAKLRHAIHSGIASRIKIKKASIINGMLAEKLQATKTSIETLKKYGYTQEQLDGAQKTVCAEFKTQISKVSDETTKADLAELDKNRGSWTHED